MLTQRVDWGCVGEYKNDGARDVIISTCATSSAVGYKRRSGMQCVCSVCVCAVCVCVCVCAVCVCVQCVCVCVSTWSGVREVSR